jgi:hypothetical protein
MGIEKKHQTHNTEYPNETHQTNKKQREKVVRKFFQLFQEMDPNALDIRLSNVFSHISDVKQTDRSFLELDALRLFAQEHGGVLHEMYRKRYIDLLSEHAFINIKDINPMNDMIQYYSIVREIFFCDPLFISFPDANTIFADIEDRIYTRADIYRDNKIKNQNNL